MVSPSREIHSKTGQREQGLYGKMLILEGAASEPRPLSYVHCFCAVPNCTRLKQPCPCRAAAPLLKQQRYKRTQPVAMQTLLPCYVLAVSSGSTVIMNVPKVSLTSSLCPA